MVRTKADSAGSSGSYRKAVAARAPRKTFGSSSSSSNPLTSPLGKKTAESKYAGGNPVCVRPTPKWQKGIGEFFGSPSSSKPEKENRVPSDDDVEEAGGSGVGKAPRKSRPLPSEDDASDDE